MIKIEKEKFISWVLRVERLIDLWRRKRSTVILTVLILILASVFFDIRKNNAANLPAGNEPVAQAPDDQTGQVLGEEAQQEADSSEFVQAFLALADVGAVSPLEEGGKEEAKIIKVPGDSDTIQKAIDVAKAGDTVYVAAGEYKENIVMKDGVSLVGEKAETTILDGDKKGNVVTFKSLGDKETRLENFSIKNAQENLGGVLIEDSSPIINRNIIFSNDYDIYIKGKSSPTVQRNVLELSKAGVQIFNLAPVEGSNPRILDNLIYGNKKGINLYNGNATIEHNTVSFNSSFGIEAGATFGIYLASSSATVRNNIVTDNGTCEICSGIYADDKSKDVTISFNDLWNNQNNFICFGQCTMEENNRSEDPVFENGLLYDFNLKAESTLLGAGSDTQRLGARL